MTIKLQIAFQGGGAKLAGLLAVVEVLQELERAGEIEVTRVSGTSAGAIAAAILACDLNVKTITLALSNQGNEYVNRIIPSSKYPRSQGKIPKIRMFSDVIRSRPMGDVQALRTVLEELFTKEKNLKGLTIRKTLFVVSADLRKNEKRVVEFTSFNNSLFDVIVDSCALPIFFRTSQHLGGSSLVDGGLVENLPIGELIKDKDEFEHGKAFAVSFESNDTNFNADNFLKYSLELLNTAIINSCKRSVQLVGESNVFSIKTDINTFDFNKALKILPSSDEYNKIKDDARAWFVNSIQMLRSSSAQMSMNDIFHANYKIYQTFHFNKKRRFTRGAMIVIARCIAHEGNKGYSVYDEIYDVYEIAAVDERIYCVAVSSESNYEDNFYPVPDVSIKDGAGDVVDAILMPAIDPNEKLAPSGAKMKNTLIYFGHPMDPSSQKTNPFTITKREFVRECMVSLKRDKRDYLAMSNGRPEVMERAELVLHVPKETPRIVAFPMQPDSDEQGSWQYRQEFEELKSADLHPYGHSPVGFRTVGWRVNNLAPGETFGLELFLK